MCLTVWRRTVIWGWRQAPAITAEKYGGTGPRLAIKRFFQIMGGDITVATEPGKGSSFTIRSPRTADAVKELRTSWT